LAECETVLVVEDEALILFTISDELRRAGYRVLEAQDADEAMHLLAIDDHVGLVFTDIDMPGSMDGLGLARMVRDRWPLVRIIVTSGKAVPDPAALPEGSRFLPKPYTSGAVVEAVQGMLA
jgi:CheY-like chemotaxis protein